MLNARKVAQVLPYKLPAGEKYQKATPRFKKEAVASLIEDNSTTMSASAKFDRAFNTSGSTSAIDRWKHQAANQ